MVAYKFSEIPGGDGDAPQSYPRPAKHAVSAQIGQLTAGREAAAAASSLRTSASERSSATISTSSLSLSQAKTVSRFGFALKHSFGIFSSCSQEHLSAGTSFTTTPDKLVQRFK